MDFTELQKKVLAVLFAEELIRRHFYLTGGTALSVYYLHHRVSDDLDLFTHSIEISEVERTAEDALKNAGMSFVKQRSSSTFRRYMVEDSLQVDLVRDVDFRIGAPHLIDRIMIDSLQNIAINKVLAIYGRMDPKDYVDLYFILKDEPVKVLDLIQSAKKKDAGLEEFQWAKVIADAETISVLPKMIVPLDLIEMKKWYTNLRRIVLKSAKP